MDIGDILVQPKGPKLFEKEQRDVARDGLKVARDIGTARLDHSRLNVFTSLSNGDKEDNFKFRVASRGPLRLGTLSNDVKLHIQVLNRVGRVVADNQEGPRLHQEKFERLVSGKGETFEAGEYYIRVSRPADIDIKKELPYSLQLQIGTEVKQDFDTIEFAARKPKPGDAIANATPTAATLGARGAAGALSEGFNNLISILFPIKNSLFGDFDIFGKRRSR